MEKLEWTRGENRGRAVMAESTAKVRASKGSYGPDRTRSVCTGEVPCGLERRSRGEAAQAEIVLRSQVCQCCRSLCDEIE